MFLNQDESSRPQEVPVEHEDEERSEVKEEVEEEITQKFNQVFVCRRDGLQVTFMLESALGQFPQSCFKYYYYLLLLYFK